LKPLGLFLIAGTRPEVIKLAPIVIAAVKEEKSRIRLELCLTGQHEALANESLSIFGLKESHNLHIMMPNQTPNDVVKAVFDRLPPVLERSHPDVVVVQGDTTSAAAAALCAFNARVQVAHVEAGLRSFDLSAPFPEEMNRRTISCAARYNFAPTESAKQNLLRESVPENTITVTGNTVVDALRIIQEEHELDAVSSIHQSIRRPFVLVSAHRRESFGIGIRNICEALKTCARSHPEIQFVYPVHPNPNINGPVRERLERVNNVLLMSPVSYLELLTLMKNCTLILSDSGGIQEEAPSFGKFCIVLRKVTERNESVELGLSELAGTDPERIVDAFSRRVRQEHPRAPFANPYGDGHAAKRILECLLEEGSKA
jgi:UDP-N-acetylglucosamine 2-epimerase (non-hydrolysing)